MSTDPPAAVIETSRLTKRYGDKVAVNQLDLVVRRGEIYGLLGPNGAGKTTTILMLLGLSEPTEGSVQVCGLDPSASPIEVKERVGYLPDDVGFYDDLSGRENLRYTARLNRIAKAVADDRVDALIAEVGLIDAADRRVGTYSRGMRQRLGLADALVKEPDVLILDEPTVNIDPEGVREIMGLVRRLRDERGVTVLLSSHLLHQVQEVCDRVGIFVAGSLVASGPIEQLMRSLGDRWTIEVGCEGDPATVHEALGEVAGLDAVSTEGGLWVVRADRDLRAELVASLWAKSLTPSHIARRGADLDAIYHRYFTGDVPQRRGRRVVRGGAGGADVGTGAEGAGR